MSLLRACRRYLLPFVSPSLPRRSIFSYMPLDSSDASEVQDTDVREALKSHKTWRWYWRRRRFAVIATAIALILCIALGVGLGVGLDKNDGDSEIQPGPTVDLVYANYTGLYLDNGVSQYLGMRYARPPTGDLRWRAPVKPENENVNRPQSAQEFGKVCLGVDSAPTSTHDEDCLFANVWGPTNATEDMKLPVMVFIQGGGYISNSNANWNGTQLVETSDNNIVFVEFNYRVGIWGFLAGEDVRKDGDLNAGLLDQRLLLEWVQEHIAKFGGDPDHVVIHGISAGSGAVALHLAAYGGRNDNLFIGAIAESIFIPAHPRVQDLEYQLTRIVEKAGCTGSKKRIECLRGKSTKDLQKLNVQSPFPGRRFSPHFYWTPCVDGDFLEDHPSSLYEQKKFVRVPSLFGTCTNEGTVFTPPLLAKSTSLATFIQDQYTGLNNSQIDNLLDIYPQGPAVPDHGSYFSAGALAYGEATFVCPTNNILDAINDRYANSNLTSSPSSTSNTPPIYSYRYNVYDKSVNDTGRGVPHVFETTAVFGPDMVTNGPESYRTYNAQVVPLMMNYIVSFVRALNPNQHSMEGAPEWEIWGRERHRMVIEAEDSAMEQVSSHEMERCDFWKDAATTTHQ